MKRTLLLVALLASFCHILCAPAARAATSLTSMLYCEQEVANTPVYSNATGTATVGIDDARTTVSVNLSTQGLSNVQFVYIQLGAVGFNGPVAFQVYSTGDGAFSTNFSRQLTAGDVSHAIGGAAAFANVLNSLESGSAYINIGTSTYAVGEIRGQIVPSSFPKPTLTSASPLQGGIGTTVTFSGSNFTTPVGVRLSNMQQSAQYVNSSTVTATIGNNGATGTLLLLTPGGYVQTGDSFIMPQRPTIFDIAPTSGPVGTVVSISGYDLTNTYTPKPTVKFNGVTVPSYNVESPHNSLVYARVPVGATIGKITLSNAGGTSTSISDFTVVPDTTAPVSCEITIPGAGVKNLTEVSGNAQDDAAGGGIGRVLVFLRRPVTGGYQYWAHSSTTNKYEWMATNRGMDATITFGTINVSWKLAANLPSGSNLPDGVYYLHAYAYDLAGNSRVSSTKPLIVDRLAPTAASIDTPATSAIMANLGNGFTGTATDNAGGSGVAQVRVYLRRAITGGYLYWGLDTNTNQLAWLTQPVYQLAGLNNPNTLDTGWSLSSLKLPSGANLPDGIYYAHVYAYDRADNSKQSATTQILVDATAPIAATVTTPANNSAVKHLGGGLIGTAQDNSGGRGIGQVRVFLKRPFGGSFQFWGLNTVTHQYEWSSTERYLTPNLAGTGNAVSWSVNGSIMPSGAKLADGAYGVYATAFDRSGNSKIGNLNQFVVDNIVPAAVSVTYPPNGVALKSLAGGLIGNAQDNTPNGGGIATVKVFLRRMVTGGYQYWGLNTTSNQYEWATTQRFFTAVLSSPNNISTNWSVNGSLLPSGANLPDGTYYVHAIAVDRTGFSLQSSPNAFRIETAAPAAVTITYPTYGSYVQNLSAGISGSAQDNAGGSGIVEVRVYLRRFDSGYQYWGWNYNHTVLVWDGPLNYVSATVANHGAVSTTWTVPASLLPSGFEDLRDDYYYLHAVAFDKAGNTKQSSTVLFQVQAELGSPPAPRSSATGNIVSSASASAGAGTVTVVFASALDAASAVDAGHYTVTLGPTAVAVENAAYNAASGTLTLGVGALAAGHGVTLKWQGVLSTNGAALSGSYGPIIAKP